VLAAVGKVAVTITTCGRDDHAAKAAEGVEVREVGQLAREHLER
jgi:hypothetical protein